MSNVYDSILPLYYGTKFLGLSTYGRSENGYKVSKIGIIYPMIIILLLLIISFHTVCNTNNMFISNEIMMVSIE